MISEFLFKIKKASPELFSIVIIALIKINIGLSLWSHTQSLKRDENIGSRIDSANTRIEAQSKVFYEFLKEDHTIKMQFSSTISHTSDSLKKMHDLLQKQQEFLQALPWRITDINRKQSETLVDDMQKLFEAYKPKSVRTGTINIRK